MEELILISRYDEHDCRYRFELLLRVCLISLPMHFQWLRDSRGAAADKSDDTEYPCIKVFTTIDAPMEAVCAYLSQEDAFPEYNDVLEKYKDIEEISPHSKICWSQSPQILFLKPRDFVTFCHHRWTRDGTQVIVNQATEHPDLPGNREEREGKACRAYALRGANCKFLISSYFELWQRDF